VGPVSSETYTYAAKGIADFARNAIDRFVDENIERIRGAAASIVDPSTGKHADVFVQRSDNRIIVTTQGSPEFARELEKRLGLAANDVTPIGAPHVTTPKLYFAHAFENRDIAKPLADRMMRDGIDVWFDEWEIRTGDSLRRKMENGLSGCTHFLVLLTPEAIGKPWVETEIDAGFVRNVEGESRFMGIRSGVGIDKLSIFLRTRRCPEINLNDEADVAGLIAEIHGESRKPALGSPPKYVTSSPIGLERWSRSAIAVAKYLVESSENGIGLLDPQTTPKEVSSSTGLPVDDVRMGTLDLQDAGLVKETDELNSDRFWPKVGLFIEFDRHFLSDPSGVGMFDSKKGAVAVAQLLVNENINKIQAQELAPFVDNRHSASFVVAF
jgi:TIR domain